MKKIVIVLIVTSLGLMFSCKKNTPETKLEILTEIEWKLVEHKAKYDDTVEDYLEEETACGKEATYIFTAEGKQIKEDGCNSLLKQYKDWKFYNNDTYIIISPSMVADTFEILEITPKKLHLKTSLYGEMDIFMVFEAK